MRMKKEGRAKLRCSKQIKGSVYDTFTVVVMEDSVDSVTKEFERQGYSVTKVS